jgi:hypothetical protein
MVNYAFFGLLVVRLKGFDLNCSGCNPLLEFKRISYKPEGFELGIIEL